MPPLHPRCGTALVPHRLPAALLPDWLPGAQPVATGERVVDVRQGRRRAVDTAVTAATAVVAVRVGAQLTPHRCLTNTRPSSGNNTATTSIRTWSKREVLSLRNCPASRRNRCIFATVTASAGVPNRCDVRVLTSTTTNVATSVATMSTSPAVDRQFLARTLIRRDCTFLTALCYRRGAVLVCDVCSPQPRVQAAAPCPPPRRTASRPVDDVIRCGRPISRRTAAEETTASADSRQASGSSRSGLANSSTMTSLKVISRTDLMNRAERYTSHTQASPRVSSKNTSPPAECTCRSTWFAR